MREQYLGTIKNEAMGIVAGGGGDQKAGLLSSMGAPVAADRIAFGREVLLSPAEISALPAEIKSAPR